MESLPRTVSSSTYQRVVIGTRSGLRGRDALPLCRHLGIERALVTCDSGNTASRKVIEANGGEFEDRRGVKLRYWIRTGN